MTPPSRIRARDVDQVALLLFRGRLGRRGGRPTEAEWRKIVADNTNYIREINADARGYIENLVERAFCEGYHKGRGDVLTRSCGPDARAAWDESDARQVRDILASARDGEV